MYVYVDLFCSVPLCVTVFSTNECINFRLALQLCVYNGDHRLQGELGSFTSDGTLRGKEDAKQPQNATIVT